MKTPNLGLLKLVRKSFGLLQSDAKVLLCHVPVMRGCGRDSSDRVRKTRQYLDKNRSRMDKFTDIAVKHRGLLAFAEYKQPLNGGKQQHPRTKDVRFPGARNHFAVRIHQRQRALSIAGISHEAEAHCYIHRLDVAWRFT